MTVLAPAMSRPDVWHGRFGPTLALALVALPFGAILIWASTFPRIDTMAAARDIRQTAALVDEHAASMTRIGERVAAAAGASSAGRAAWLGYAQHMIADGRTLVAVAQRLRDVAVLAETDPTHGGNAGIGVAVMSARWNELRADGQATAQHGRVMVQMANDLTAGVRQGILTPADATEIQRASAGMVQAGERVAQAAGQLLGSVDQMQRWMGAGR